MSPRGGIDGEDSISPSLVSYGFPTREMLGESLFNLGFFHFIIFDTTNNYPIYIYHYFFPAENLYPRIDTL